MTVTRLYQTGFELNTISELESYPDSDFGTQNMTISTTKARTGSRAMRMNTADQPRGKSCSTTQIAAGFYINHNNVAGGDQAIVAIIRSSFATPSLVYWDETSGELRLRVNNSTVDTIDAAAAGFGNVDTWYHIGITYKADASSGFFSVYLDGVEILTYSGNTGTTINGVYVGGETTGTGGWSAEAYVDDFYLNDTVGESDAPPSSYRYLWSITDGAGASTNLTPNTGTNYAAVDDTTPDDDTTYVYATASGVKDSYTTANVTVPAGHSVVAVIPTAWARKTDSGTDSQWKLGTRASGGTEVLGSAQSLGTGYAIIWDRQTTEPGGAAWDETKVNASEAVIESAGSF